MLGYICGLCKSKSKSQTFFFLLLNLISKLNLFFDCPGSVSFSIKNKINKKLRNNEHSRIHTIWTLLYDDIQDIQDESNKKKEHDVMIM